jgi:hypothetical protein
MSNYWDLEEGGGGVQEFTGVVDEAYFSDGEYGVSLMIKIRFDDPENFPRFEDGCFTRYFSVGKGWSTRDGGDTVTHEAGDGKRFNKSSKIGALIGQMGSVPAIRESLTDFNPYEAKSWKGLHLHWGQVPVEKRRRVKDDNGMETDKWESYAATELLPVGLAGSANGQAPATFDLATLTNVDMASLVLLGQMAATDKAFMEAVIANPALATNASLMAAMSKNLSGLVAALKAEVI